MTIEDTNARKRVILGWKPYGSGDDFSETQPFEFDEIKDVVGVEQVVLDYPATKDSSDQSVYLKYRKRSMKLPAWVVREVIRPWLTNQANEWKSVLNIVQGLTTAPGVWVEENGTKG